MAEGPKSESSKSRVQISVRHLTIAFFSCLSTIPGVTFFLREVCDGGAGLVWLSKVGLHKLQHGTVGSMDFGVSSGFDRFIARDLRGTSFP